MHCISKGFEDLAVPSNKALAEIQYHDIILSDKAKKYQQVVANKPKLGMVPVTPSHDMMVDQAAGYRAPKPFKKTFVDKIPEWFENAKT